MSEKNYLNCCKRCNWCWWWWNCCPKPTPTDACVSTANLLVNGDFEDETTAPWVFDNAVLDDSDKFSGDNIALLNGREASVSQEVEIPTGCPLQLSFAAKSSQGAQQVTKVKVTFSTGETFEQEFTPSANDYTTFLYALETPEDASSAVVEFINRAQGVGNRLKIDLIVLKV
ncbi:MAG: hypothetical protein R6V17_02730 [Halanaerobacter sp.]